MKEDSYIDDDEIVTAYHYGNTLEMSNVVGSEPIVVKYDADHMVNKLTGEIIEVDHCDDRSDPRLRKSLKASFKRLKRLIGANFTNIGPRSGLWLTLTYAQPDGKPMRDQKRLYQDFRKFIQKVKRKIKPRKLLYVVAMEPQAFGSFHAHVLMKTLDKKPFYLKNDDVASMWGQGFVNVRRIKQADNVSAYLMAYLTDIDIKNPNDEIDINDNKGPKSIVKGGRIGFYPLHFNLYRASRNCSQPEKIKSSKQSIKEKLGIEDAEPSYSRKFEISRSSAIPFEIKVEYYDIKKAELAEAIAKIKKNTNQK